MDSAIVVSIVGGTGAVMTGWIAQVSNTQKGLAEQVESLRSEVKELKAELRSAESMYDRCHRYTRRLINSVEALFRQVKALDGEPVVTRQDLDKLYDEIEKGAEGE